MTAAAHHRSTEINYRDLLVSSIKSALAAFEHAHELIEWAHDRAEIAGDDLENAVDGELVEPLIDPARRVVAALSELEDAALQIEAVSSRREPAVDAYRRFTGDHPAARAARVDPTQQS